MCSLLLEFSHHSVYQVFICCVLLYAEKLLVGPNCTITGVFHEGFHFHRSDAAGRNTHHIFLQYRTPAYDTDLLDACSSPVAHFPMRVLPQVNTLPSPFKDSFAVLKSLQEWLEYSCSCQACY